MEKDLGLSGLSQNIEPNITPQPKGKSTKKKEREEEQDLSLELNGHKVRLSSISTDKALNRLTTLLVLVTLLLTFYFATVQ